MSSTCPTCGQPAKVFIRHGRHGALVCRSCFRPDPSEGRGVSGREVSPVHGAGDGGEATPTLSSFGLPANPSGDTPHSVKGVGASRHAVPGPFDGDC